MEKNINNLENMNIGFVGAGAMGSAIIEGLIKSKIENRKIYASVNTNESAYKLKQNYNINTFTSIKETVENSDVIILAVKPYMAETVSEEINKYIKSNAVIISVLASVSSEKLKTLFPSNDIVRTMPNTPVKVGSGYTVIVFDNTIKKESFEKAESIFQKIGKVKVIEEKLIHAYTATAGCSPAFIYVLIEAMADAGVLTGIKRADAIELSAQIFKGSAEMVLNGTHPAILKDSVCTPAGLTIKGIEELEKRALRSGLIETINASYQASILSEKK